MTKILFNFEFNYYMGESVEEENKEDAKYKIEVNSIKLSKEEITDMLLYIKTYLKNEIGYHEIKEQYINNEHAIHIETSEVEAQDIMNVLNKFHTKLKILFNDAKVEDISQVGNNDLSYNTRKYKL